MKARPRVKFLIEFLSRCPQLLTMYVVYTPIFSRFRFFPPFVGAIEGFLRGRGGEGVAPTLVCISCTLVRLMHRQQFADNNVTHRSPHSK